MLSSSQWTSRNLVENCIGNVGQTGPSGPKGPDGPKGSAGGVGLKGAVGSTGNVGILGLGGSDGSIGPNGPLPLQIIDAWTTTTMTISLAQKYTTFIFSMERPLGDTSTIHTITINPSTGLRSYTQSDFWIRIIPQNITTPDVTLTLKIIVNSLEMTFPPMNSIQTNRSSFGGACYIYWNGSGLVLY